MSADQHQLQIGWDRIPSMVIEIKKRIDTLRGVRGLKGDPRYIVGVSRGGLIPAVMLSHIYSRPTIQVIQASSYDQHNKQGDIRIFADGQAQEVLRSPDCVIVDDIIDSGKTRELLRVTWPKPLFAALCTKSVWPNDNDTIAGTMIPQNSWIVFPWESNL